MGILRFLLTTLCVFWITVASAATTYYVRSDGGTSVQCTGTTNAAYPGSGTGQACAFNHPAWVLGAGTTAKWTGGDTMVIKDTLADNTTQATYMVGYGMPNTGGCSASTPYSCVMNAIPSGTDSTHPTKIYGSSYNTGCATKPQLWGTQSAWTIFTFYGKSNIDVECLEITDHSNCKFRNGASQCSETYPNSATYSRNGIETNGATNITMKNLDIHGMAKEGMNAGDFSGTTVISHVNIDGNGYGGWDGDDTTIGGAGNLNTGTMVIDHLRIRFNGCVEAYPRSASYTASDYSGCTDQNASGYGDGFAAGGTTGTINMTYSEFSHNTQDGLDFLHANGAGTLNIDKTLFEGNTGNQLKYTEKNISLTNSVIIANCTYLKAVGKVSNTSTWGDCRADGGPISASTGAAGGAWKFYNNTVYTSTGSGGSPFIEVVNGNGLCNGTETYLYKNNILVSNFSTTNWTPFYSGLSGSCATPFAAPTDDHNTIYHFTSNPAGTGNVFTDPKFTTAISATASSNIGNIPLQTTSPSKGTATTGTYWNTSTDYNNFPQNGSIDMGAIAYGSSAVLTQAGQTCVATSDCAAGTCSAFACTGSCTATGNGCATNGQCCSNYCSASICSITPTCGDGVIQAGETCDGSNLANNTCITQGFTGGSLSCASNCQSFVTSSCTNTLVFPLTPILDNFNRANEGPPLSSNWIALNENGLKVTSNQCAVVTTNTTAQAYWNAATFNKDEEVYVTLVTANITEPTALRLKYSTATNSGYRLRMSDVLDQVLIQRVDAGVITTLSTISQTVASGYKFGMSYSTGTLTAYVDSGSGWGSIGSIADSTYLNQTGVLVLELNDPNTAARVDDFGGGSLNPVTCGNGLKEVGELCDGADLGGQSCLTQGFASGTLACASNCGSLDTSSCTSASTCGNNTQETGEVCDGTDLNSGTCITLGFVSGTLSCAANCGSYVTTYCTGDIRPGANRGYATNRGFV